MSAPESFIGKRVTCPKCKTGFPIVDPRSSEDFEVVEEEPLPVAEVVEDDPPKPQSVAKPAARAVAPGSVAVASGKAKGKDKKPNPKHKTKVDASDYLTRVNGRPLAVRPGEDPPPTSLPRKSPPRV